MIVDDKHAFHRPKKNNQIINHAKSKSVYSPPEYNPADLNVITMSTTLCSAVMITSDTSLAGSGVAPTHQISRKI